jgi:ribosomal protein S18 acetylase RimI-like enzyme
VLPDHVHRLWSAMDDLFADVVPTAWGAVVTDGRYPRIWDANYARIERPATLDQVAAALGPALRRARADVFHVVMLDVERTSGLLAELSSAGHRLAWDVVMEVASGALDGPAHDIEVLEDGAELREAITTSLGVFGIEPAEALAQLQALEADVMVPGGKRWYGVREAGRIVSIAARLTTAGVTYVDNVATVPEARGRGYASDIVRAIVRDAGSVSERTVLLADPGDERVVAMYGRLGFTEVGRIASTKGPIPPPQPTNL